MATVGKPATETEYNVTENQIKEKKRELLKSLEEQVNKVDRNVTQFAKSFDSLFKNLRSGSDDFEKNAVQQDQDKDDGDKFIFSRTQENMSNLIASAEAVDNNKVKAIESLSKLIHFIHADREEISTNQSLESCKVLCIDTYLKSCTPSDQNGDALIEMLQEQNKRLHQKYMLSREHVKIISEREKLVNIDRKSLREQLEKLKSDINTQKSKSTSHDNLVYDNEYFTKCKTSVMEYADDGSILPTFGRDEQTRNQSTQTSNDDVQGVAREVKTSRSVVKPYDHESKCQMADQRITELQSELQILKYKLTGNEELLRSVVCRDVYEVTMVNHTLYQPNNVESALIRKIHEEMERQSVRLNVKETAFAQGVASIVTCIRESKSRSWETILDSVLRRCTESSNILLVVLYDKYDTTDFDEAILQKCAALDKYITMPLSYSSTSFYPNVKQIQKIVQFIKTNGKRKREVVRCGNCKNQFR